MDATLLINPAFWNDPQPFVPGGFGGEIPSFPELESHVLFQTSGSTGNPKWIALSKSALLLSAACVNRHLKVSDESRWGLALPWHHVGGFGVAARSFEAACGMVVFPGKWNAPAFHSWLAAERITHTSLVPTQVHDLVTAGLTAPAALEAIVVGGGRLAGDQGIAARELGWPVLASYGMTEACSQIATQPLELLEIPYQTGSIPLLDIWNARTDDTGVLEISGPALFSGSLVRNGATWTYDERRSDWHRTSDRAILDRRVLSPLGRNDSIVKVLGELVDVEEIERELAEISKRAFTTGHFAVVALPDVRAEHRLVPVFEKPIDPNLVLNVLTHYQNHALGYRRLQPPVFVDRFPRSELGKIQRTALRKMATE